MKPSPLADPSRPLAVLVSGGLDSAILLGESIGRHPAVYPIYIRVGSVWESVELDCLKRFLGELRSPALRPLTILEQPVADLYGEHWSLTGENVPDAESPDQAVYLPGRNVLLLGKAMLWCHLNRVPALALAPLSANPFPDATPKFFTAFQDAVNLAVDGTVQIAWPYLHLSKAELLQRGRHLPLQFTLSCIRPVDGRHCGACNKCAERQRGFHDAGMDDTTEYAVIGDQ